MEFKKGDLVTRISHKHDCVFKILNIDNNIAYLKGENVRLYADSPLKDLKKYLKDGYDSFEKDLKNEDISDRGDYFYLPIGGSFSRDYVIKNLNDNKSHIYLYHLSQKFLVHFGNHLKKEQLRAKIPNDTEATCRIGLYSTISGSTQASFKDVKYTIINGFMEA